MCAVMEIRDLEAGMQCPKCGCELDFRGARKEGGFFRRKLVTYYQCPHCLDRFRKA